MFSPFTTGGKTLTILVLSDEMYSHERSYRVAIFFGGAALAGAFGGMYSVVRVPIAHISRHSCLCDRQNGGCRRQKRMAMVRTNSSLP